MSPGLCTAAQSNPVLMAASGMRARNHPDSDFDAEGWKQRIFVREQMRPEYAVARGMLAMPTLLSIALS